MQKEPIPFISGPGALLFVNALAVIYYFTPNSIFNPDVAAFLFPVAFLILPPLYNLIFHAIWKIFLGYASFGYQRKFTDRFGKSSHTRSTINKVYDKYIYGLYKLKSDDNPEKVDLSLFSLPVDYARRRVASYLMYLQAKFTSVLFFIIGLVLLFLLLWKHDGVQIITSGVILAINLILYFIFREMSKIIHNQLFNFEKNILLHFYGEQVEKDIERDVEKML